MKPNQKHYSLVKIKILKGGGVDATFREKQTVKGTTDTKDWNLKSSENAHPDLTDKINDLKQFLAKCYNMDAMIVLANSKGLDKKEKDAFKIVNKTINNVYLENMKKIEVTGLSITGEVEGDKDGRSVCITGTQLQENKSKTALNSPKIKLANDQFKFEADVQELVDLIQEEVYDYLFNGKKAQLSMFNETKEEKLKVAV